MTTAALLILTTALMIPVAASAHPMPAAHALPQQQLSQPVIRVANKTPEVKIQLFTLDKFIENMKAGAPFIVFTSRMGDPISTQQEPPLEVLLNDNKFDQLSALKLDIDAQPDDALKLYVDKPGMIMIYRDGKEVSRTTNVTDSNKINQMVTDALNTDPVPAITLPE